MTRLQQITRDGKAFHLTHNQRNLYLYFLAHQRKHPHAPCFIPRCPIQGSYRAGEECVDMDDCINHVSQNDPDWDIIQIKPA